MENKDIFADAIQELEDLRKVMIKAAEESEDVKEGNCTEDDEKSEPAFILFDQISKSSISMLKQPIAEKIFNEIQEKLGYDTTKGLIELFVVTMTHSAHNAILFYDDLLKQELTKQFDHMGEYINNANADIKAHKAVLEVFRKDLNEIKSKLLIDQFNKESGQNSNSSME